ncbi:hypothetical protein [Ponticoccus alexandrii]|nr:hypothetical protein [Ponticoccus alexandrii]
MTLRGEDVPDRMAEGQSASTALDDVTGVDRGARGGSVRPMI